MIGFFEGTVTTAQVVKNLPAGGVVFIQTDLDIAIAWWNDAAEAFGTPQTITAPGEEVSVAHWKAEITAAAPATVQIIKGS